jgi:hypothetical protein
MMGNSFLLALSEKMKSNPNYQPRAANPTVEIERHLDLAKLRPLSSYGWIDERTEDPDFIGHAMWQVDPPISDERFFWTFSADANTPPPPMPTDRQQTLMVSGTDFEGLMAWARLSIGVVLSQASLLREHLFSDATFFELHRAGAVIYLSTASDRVRDFFVMAAFGKLRGAYDRQGPFQGEPRAKFKTVFAEALQHHGTRHDIQANLSALLPLADEVEQLRKVRNQTIHELATEAARRERQSLERPLRQAERDMDFHTIQEAARNHRLLQDQRLDSAVQQLCRWYALLVKLSNETFIVENRLRV